MSRPTTARLLEVDAIDDEWKGGRELVPLDLSACPRCGEALSTLLAGQMALFRHGGYGATRTSTTLLCTDCGWVLERDITETNPRRDGHG